MTKKELKNSLPYHGTIIIIVVVVRLLLRRPTSHVYLIFSLKVFQYHHKNLNNFSCALNNLGAISLLTRLTQVWVTWWSWMMKGGGKRATFVCNLCGTLWKITRHYVNIYYQALKFFSPVFHTHPYHGIKCTFLMNNLIKEVYNIP